VVCRRCERWNLTPQEERWEAMEQAERLYRGTRLRAATDNVGLARLRDGTELVRIGAPLRPEFAAWRYGDQFGRRRNRQLLWVGGALAVGTVVVVAGPVMGLFSLGGFAQAPNWINLANQARRARKRIALGEGSAGSALKVSLIGAERVRLAADADHGFALYIPLADAGHGSWGSWGGRGLLDDGSSRKPEHDVRLVGREALVAASRVLPHVNRGGGSAEAVRGAVDLLDAAGGSEALFASLARDERRHQGQWSWMRNRKTPAGALSGLSAEARLALEMGAHEEQERRALEGELRELEAAWEQAEEIAAIADDLLLPEGLSAKLDQLKGRSSARTGDASSPTSDSGGASSS
jgi:hypothetical protein